MSRITSEKSIYFDIAIPNPGARLWALYRRIHELDREIGQPFVFSLKYDGLTETTWLNEAAKYGVVLTPPPPRLFTISISRCMGDPNGGTEIFDFVAPEGYSLVTNQVALIATPVSCDGVWFGVGREPAAIFPPNSTVTATPTSGPAAGRGGTFSVKSIAFGGEKHASWFLMYMATEGLAVNVRMNAQRTEGTWVEWQMRSWTALRDAAFAAFQADRARLQSELTWG
jgi:hypothetical protein